MAESLRGADVGMFKGYGWVPVAGRGGRSKVSEIKRSQGVWDSGSHGNILNPVGRAAERFKHMRGMMWLSCHSESARRSKKTREKVVASVPVNEDVALNRGGGGEEGKLCICPLFALLAATSTDMWLKKKRESSLMETHLSLRTEPKGDYSCFLFQVIWKLIRNHLRSLTMLAKMMQWIILWVRFKD